MMIEHVKYIIIPIVIFIISYFLFNYMFDNVAERFYKKGLSVMCEKYGGELLETDKKFVCMLNKNTI